MADQSALALPRQRRDLDFDDWDEWDGATATWVCIGLVVLALALVAGCVTLCCCCCRRRRRGKILRAKPVQSPTIMVTHPSTTHISTSDTTTTTQQTTYPPQQSGYHNPPPSGYQTQPGGYPPQQAGYPGYPPQQGGYPPQQGGYPYPQPVYAPGAHDIPPPYDGHPRQAAYNPGFQAGPGDAKTPL